MSEHIPNWHIITGGPSSGKSTTIDAIAELGHPTVPEAALAIINEGLDQGLSLEEIRGDEEAWQAKILARMRANEAAADPEADTFFDRGVHDGVAYFRAKGLPVPEIWQAVAGTKPYKTVFLLEPLPTFEQSYARSATEDLDFTRRITDITYDVYAESGMEPIRVPYMPVRERAAFMLSHLQLPQVTVRL